MELNRCLRPRPPGLLVTPSYVGISLSLPIDMTMTWAAKVYEDDVLPRFQPLGSQEEENEALQGFYETNTSIRTAAAPVHPGDLTTTI